MHSRRAKVRAREKAKEAKEAKAEKEETVASQEKEVPGAGRHGNRLPVGALSVKVSTKEGTAKSGRA